MKRLLAAGAAMLTLAGCGGGSSAVGANSSESTEITAVGTIVGNATAPAPTPTATPDDTGAMGNDTAVAAAADATADTATDDAATASDDHPGDDDNGGVKQE